MGLFDNPFKSESNNQTQSGAIEGGKQKKDGSHDHRTNAGNDRTPSQKEGDKKKQKD